MRIIWAFARAYWWSVCHLFTPHQIVSVTTLGYGVVWIAAVGPEPLFSGTVEDVLGGRKIIKEFYMRKAP